MPLGWLIFLIIISAGTEIFFEFVKPAIQRRRQEQKSGKELEEPFAAEVLFREEAVADLSDRQFIEMFWRNYRIVLRTEELL